MKNLSVYGFLYNFATHFYALLDNQSINFINFE